MANYWISNKEKSVRKNRQAELKLLLDFTNTELTIDKNRSLKKRMLEYLYQHKSLHPDNQNEKLPDEETADQILKIIQGRLRSRLEDIFIKNSTMEMWDDLPLWSIQGTVKLFADPKSKGYHEEFQFDKVTFEDTTNKFGKELDGIVLNNLLKINNLFSSVLKLALIEIIRDLDLSGEHFLKCARCNKFFHNPTKKEKLYCSTKCTNAIRQQKFRKRKAEEGE